MEKEIRDKLKEAFSFTNDDIRIPVGGENGADIKLSARAKVKFPFSVECKNRETFETIYQFYAQAKGHDEKLIPLLLIKSNRKPTLAILDFDYLLTLIQRD